MSGIMQLKGNLLICRPENSAGASEKFPCLFYLHIASKDWRALTSIQRWISE